MENPRLALVIWQNDKIIVIMEVKSTMAFLPEWEIKDCLDKYAEQYGIEREGLSGFTIPLIPEVSCSDKQSVRYKPKYQVLESGKAADGTNFPRLKDALWSKSIFDTFEEAQKYARMWLGPNWGGSNNGLTGVVLTVNVPFDFGGGVIEIREIN